MTLTEARAIVIDSVLHVATGSYDTTKQDRAIRWAGEHWCRRTKCSRVVVNVDVADTDTTADVTAAVATAGLQSFHPASVLHIRIGTAVVKVVDFETIRQARLTSPTGTGKPTMIAFESTTGAAELYPIVNDDYTLTIAYWEPFTFWTPTDPALDPDNIVLNIDERWVYEVLTAAGAWMVRGEQGNPWAAGELLRFEKEVVRGMGETFTSPGTWVRRDNER